MSKNSTILIKKYENRRLYSAAEKKYITLEDIHGYVKKGIKVQVIEVTTEDDITSEILTQILIEQGKANHLPVEVLEMMIKMNDVWLKQFWSPYFSNSFKMFSELSNYSFGSLTETIKPLFKSWMK